MWKCILFPLFFHPPQGDFRHFFQDHKILWSNRSSSTRGFPDSGRKKSHVSHFSSRETPAPPEKTICSNGSSVGRISRFWKPKAPRKSIRRAVFSIFCRVCFARQDQPAGANSCSRLPVLSSTKLASVRVMEYWPRS